MHIIIKSNFLFDNNTLIVLLESLFSSLSVNFNWNDCNWEFKISIYLKSGYLSFGLESTLKKELVIENVRAICWIVPQKYLLLLDQTILLQFRSSIDRSLNLPHVLYITDEIILLMLKLVSNKIDTYLTSLWRRERYLFSVCRGILPVIFRWFSKKNILPDY
jgi:hypothetical protein